MSAKDLTGVTLESGLFVTDFTNAAINIVINTYSIGLSCDIDFACRSDVMLLAQYLGELDASATEHKQSAMAAAPFNHKTALTSNV